MNVEPAKRQFLEYIEIERGRAVKTIENYDRYLSRYFVHMKIKECQRHHRAERPRVPPVAQPPAGDCCRLDETSYPELLHDCAPRISEVPAEARYRGYFAREDRACEAPRAPARPYHPRRTRATLMQAPHEAFEKKKTLTKRAIICATAPFSRCSSLPGSACPSSARLIQTSTSRAMRCLCAVKARRCASSLSPMLQRPLCAII